MAKIGLPFKRKLPVDQESAWNDPTHPKLMKSELAEDREAEKSEEDDMAETFDTLPVDEPRESEKEDDAIPVDPPEEDNEDETVSQSASPNALSS